MNSTNEQSGAPPPSGTAPLPPSLTGAGGGASPPPEASGTKAAGKPARIAVVATRRGYYARVERNKGDSFFIDQEEDFSAKWMEKVPAKKGT